MPAVVLIWVVVLYFSCHPSWQLSQDAIHTTLEGPADLQKQVFFWGGVLWMGGNHPNQNLGVHTEEDLWVPIFYFELKLIFSHQRFCT